MTHQAMKHYLTFFIVLLLCGGGCMYMPYIPAQQMDLKVVGLDEQTRARLMGQAEPRPNDPEPEAGLGGRLGIVPLGQTEHLIYGLTADISPTDEAYERLSKLQGVTHAYNAAIDRSDDAEAKQAGEARADIDFKKRLLDDAQTDQADVLLIYTTGHNAKAFDLTLGIGQIFLLGFCPTVVFNAEANTTAILMDAKTGYIYALTTGEGGDGAVGIGWGRAKKKAEAASNASAESFDDIINKLEAAWPTLQMIYP